MSASNHTIKKAYLPPRLSLGDNSGVTWQHGAGSGRMQSLPRVDGPMPPPTTRPRAASVYPTVRRPNIGDTPPPRGGTLLRAPNFLSATQARRVHNPYANDLGEESRSDADSKSGSKGSDSDSDSDSDARDSSTDKGADGSDEDEGEEEEGEDGSSGDEGSPPPIMQSESLNQLLVASKNQNQKPSASRVKVKVGAPMLTSFSPTEESIMSIDSLTPGERSIAMNHTRKTIMSLCGGKKLIKELVELELQYKPNNEPQWVDETGNVLMHPDLSFDENMNGFGHLFDDAVTDHSRMAPAHRPFLSKVEKAVFRECFGVGTFKTFKDDWNAAQAGRGEARVERRRSTSRVAGRKTNKAETRGKALKATDLDYEAFKCFVDPGAQSTDYLVTCSSDGGSKNSGPKDKKKKKKKRIVNNPNYRTETATKFVDALDVKYESMKKRSRNSPCELVEYVKTNSAVPKLKNTGVKISAWAVGKDWLDANPQLERKSRALIDHKKTTMPQADLVKQFLHEYEPEPRVSVNLPKHPTPEAGQPSTAQSSLPFPSIPSLDLPLTTSVEPSGVPAPDATSVLSDWPTVPDSTDQLGPTPALNDRPSVPTQPPASFVPHGQPFQAPADPGLPLTPNRSQPGAYNFDPNAQPDLPIDYMNFDDYTPDPESTQGAYSFNQSVYAQQDLRGPQYLHEQLYGRGGLWPSNPGNGSNYSASPRGMDQYPQQAHPGLSYPVRGPGSQDTFGSNEMAYVGREGQVPKRKVAKEKPKRSSERKSKFKAKSDDPGPSNLPPARKRKFKGREVEDEEPIAESSNASATHTRTGKWTKTKKIKVTGLVGK
ncbi:hypothetical protein RSAG8_10684, partial [Rhizoctonia solani AG-8 WAC10335]